MNSSAERVQDCSRTTPYAMIWQFAPTGVPMAEYLRAAVLKVLGEHGVKVLNPRKGKKS